ncbi:MAG: GAF domain-containing sensor histidine kinase [Anaerolineae bacterium]
MPLPPHLKRTLRRAIRDWFQPRSTDLEESFRELSIRVALPIVLVIRLMLVLVVVTHVYNIPSALGLIGLMQTTVLSLVPLIYSLWALHRQKIGQAGLALMAAWVISDVTGAFFNGYWLSSVQLSLMTNIMFSALLLPQALGVPYTVMLIVIFNLAARWGVAPAMPLTPAAQTTEPLSMQYMTAMVSFWFIVVSLLMRFIKGQLNRRISALNDLVTTLEQRITNRTRDLALSVQVSRQVSQVLDLDQLLPQLVDLTAFSYNLYHVSVYLYNDKTQVLRLEAATGTAGKLMVKRGVQFPLNRRGLISLAARDRTAQIINLVRDSQEYMPNPLLPETQSEVALPMMVKQTLIGVLNLQSEQAGRFGSDEVQVFSLLADQIAVAVRNAQLFKDSREARLEAEKSNHVKSAFLASMSHELRTPLNAIINLTMFVSSGLLGPVAPKQSSTLNDVVGAGQHLLSLINDVLDMSKIESGSLRLLPEENVDLTALLEQAAATTRTLLGDKPVKFTLDIAPHLPSIRADRQRLLQVCLNLLSNACKFTEQGEITLKAWVTPGSAKPSPNDDHIMISVSDTGPGINEADFPLVFEPFKQTESGLRQGGGTGLGLPISRNLVEAHQGRIWLESQLGVGTTFFVELPVHSEQLKVLFSSTIPMSADTRNRVSNESLPSA